ncbi:hypothetical protein [Bacillus albus]|uniref:hypothetical protein n=1 Tax=Bacillus albus TaxID=2026189 RepID=UPI001021A995|nr:hypothetical protein [Bacillus albus]
MKTKLDMSYDVMYEHVINSGVTIKMDNNTTKVAGAFYNVGADEILKDIAMVYLRELECEFAKSEHNSQGFQRTNELYKEIGMRSDEEVNDLLQEYDNEMTMFRGDMEKEHFIAGFLTGYKLMKTRAEHC